MHFRAILHDVRSVHNVGSIFRTADGAGFEKIYLCGITPRPTDRFGKLRPDFAKVALGAEKNISWEFVEDIAALIPALKKEGWDIAALEQAKNSIPYYAFAPGKQVSKVALIVGNEVGGIPAGILDAVDQVIEIPMLGKKESLNVSVSFGVAAYRMRFS